MRKKFQNEFEQIVKQEYLFNYNRKKSYKAFVSGIRDNYNSIIYDIKFKKEKDKLIIKFVGTSFYRYMIRKGWGNYELSGNDGKCKNLYGTLL